MSDYLDQIKADAFVGLSVEFEYDGVLQGASGVTPSGPKDYGQDPWPFNSIYIEASDSGGTLTPDVRKTYLYFSNLGHILPMEWTVTRTVTDNTTSAVLSTTNTTFTLVSSATFTCQTNAPNSTATFTATFKSPA